MGGREGDRKEEGRKEGGRERTGIEDGRNVTRNEK